jgi:protein-tyrosine phosphatase
MTRTDIHCHVLPGLDDGCADIEESVAMAAAMTSDGTGTAVATPHVRPDHVVDVADLPERVGQLQDWLRKSSIELRLHCGGELGHTMVGRLSQAELDTIALGPPHARWLLVETPFEGIHDDFHAATDELRDRGFGLVLAHPERSLGLDTGDFRALRRELAAGALAQVNVWSLVGRHGDGPEATGAELLRRGLAGLIASDAHPGWREPLLSTGRRAALAHGIDEATARRLTETTPAQLLLRGLPKQELAAA